MSPTLHNGATDIVRDSIIQNKEKTKNYWEQLMMAAATSNNKNNINGSNNTLNHSNSRNSISSVESEDGPNVKEEKRRIERELALGNVSNISNQASMQSKIAAELQLMQQREDELRLARSLSMEMKISPEGSNCSEYGSDESIRPDSLRHRAQSMESVSSGLSSGSISGTGSGAGSATTGGVADVALLEAPRRRRSVTVRPYDDPEEVQEVAPKSRFANETPIEREIRVACEREAELRRVKGIPEPTETVKEVSSPIAEVKEKNAVPTAMPRKEVSEAKPGEPRDVQLTLATHRIEREIAEASERETQLRTMGRILTTSIDTVDSKIIRYTDLAEISEQDKARRPRKSIATITIPDEESTVVPRKFSLQDNRKLTSSNTQRGMMQRFIASKGRLGAPSTPIVTPSAAASLQRPSSPLASPPNSVPPSRNGFLSAEEKIQSELEEMQRREEELRLQRAHSMARSQPNLLTIADEDEEGEREAGDESTPEPRSLRHSSLPHFASNPNLTLNKIHNHNTATGRRKRFSLLEEWENRIQNL